MAAVFLHSYLYVLICFSVCLCTEPVERRFSDLKRCADEECSMLLCRGKAARDFSGPDCRFLPFKKGETIYVYYKLSGQRSDLWAGSVGSSFGYFPKDFLNINHIYTENEVEVRAEETDFVCFDTGLDKFKSYDIDVLLSSSLLLTEGDGKDEKSEGISHREDAEIKTKDTKTPVKEPQKDTDGEGMNDSDLPSKKNEAEELDNTDDDGGLEKESESSEKNTEDADLGTKTRIDDMTDDSSSTDGDALKKSDHVTEVEALPELQTTLGTTFDAVTSDDEHTQKVTPYFEDEESSKVVEPPSEQAEEGPKETPLLPYIEYSKHEGIPPEPSVEKQEDTTEVNKDGNMWSSLGDTVFNIVSGGEKTVLPEDDDDEDDDYDEDDENEEEEEEKMGIDSDKSDKDSEDQLHVQSSDILLQSLDSEKDAEAPQHDQGLEGKEDSEAPQHDQVLLHETNSEDPLHNQGLESERDSEDPLHDQGLGSEQHSEGHLHDQGLESKTNSKDPLPDQGIQTKKDSEDPLHVHSLEREKDSEDHSHDPGFENLSNLEDPQHNTRSETSDSKDSPKNSITEDSVSANDAKTGDSKESAYVSTTEDITKDTKASDAKHYHVDSSSSDNKDAEVEQNSKLMKHENEAELVSNEKSDLISSVDETLKDALAESKHEPQIGNLEDVSFGLTAAKTDWKAQMDERVQFHDTMSFFTEDTQNTPEVEVKKHDPIVEVENDGTFDDELKAEDEPDAEEEPDINEKKDEQIEKAKNDLVHLLDNTLKAEQHETEDHDGNEEIYEENEEDPEELLEDENAILFTKTMPPEQADEVKKDTEKDESKAQSENGDEFDKVPKEELNPQTITDSKSNTEPSVNVKETDADGGADEIKQEPVTSEEPEYSDGILRLTLLRDHFKDEEMERIQKYLDLKDLFKIEAMFTELEQELKSARDSNSKTSEDIERTLETILEVSENSILDEIEKMLDTRERKTLDSGKQMDPVMFDDEAAILDDFQEFAFYLRQKYSVVIDSVPLAEESQLLFDLENVNASEVEDAIKSTPVTEAADAPEVHEEAKLPEVNVEDGESHSQDMGLEEDGGHFNKNKDIQTGFKNEEDVQRGPQAILENPLDISLGFEMEPASGSLESPSASDFYENSANYDQASTSVSAHVWSWMVVASEFLSVYADIMISALPEEWQPGPTFRGLPWKPVVATAVVGVLTVLMFFWRTILAVKSRAYQLTEKQLAERIQQLVREKSEVLLKINELNDMVKQHEEKLKNSEKSRSSTQKQFEEIKTRYQELNSQREELSVNITQLGQKITDKQEENKALNEKVVIMQKRIEKHQNSLKQSEDERSKVQVLMDEAKLRDDALKAQVLSFERDNSALKEQKKSLLRDAKDWQEKHEKLSEDIKVYHKKQKELEDSLVHKENEIDVLSSCIAELKTLEVCDGTELQKGDSKLANGDTAEKKGDPIKSRLKQMMDVSRIKATLSVIEDERNRYLENFLNEQKSRQELEEQFQKVMHDQTNLKNEKTHLESQYKNLQQRLEITTELYQQKETVLQQKLTQEELERREKETKLSEVDGRALQAEEELNILRQKVKDVQEEMQQNERALKAEIAVQEKKAHENWLKARSSERALIEERRESANLRQKIVECSDKMSDLEHALYKSGPPDRHMPSVRRGDSYGPSPVSGGAPSPPLMIEGPGRPPSAPVGRRNEPFGPRPPSDPHGRFSDLGHPLPTRPDMFAPRTSSPCTQDGSFQLSKSQSQGSFLPSPIRDSPVPASNAPPKAYGPPPMGGPLPPNGPLPPMIRPPNGHPSMILPGPPLGPDPRFRPPHMDSFGPPPLRPFGPVPPPFVRGPLPRDLTLRDLPPMGLPLPPLGAPDYPPDFTGPRDLPFPPRPFPPGSLPPPGAMGPPPFGARDFRGPHPPMRQSSRDSEMTQTIGQATDGPPQAGAAQNSGMAEP